MSSELKPITCRAAVMYEEGAPLKVEQIIVDPPTGTQVRVRMVATGVCASDAHYVWGEQKLQTKPSVLGHEGGGIVESVGELVSDLKVGDHVLANIVSQCGECEQCVKPNTNMCFTEGILTNGATPNKKLANGSGDAYSFCGVGAFSEYILVDRSSQLVKIDPKLDLSTTCIISCAVTTGFYAATNQAKVTANSTVAVWGLGAIGLNAVYGAKCAGARAIIGVDINNDKRTIGEHYGVTEFVNPRELPDGQSVDEYLMQKYRGVDYAIECIGHQATIDAAFKSLSFSGTLALVGLGNASAVNYPAIYLLMGRSIVGGFLGRKPGREAFPELAQMYADGKYDLEGLITHRLPLDEINDAFRLLKEGKSIRTVIVFNDQK